MKTLPLTLSVAAAALALAGCQSGMADDSMASSGSMAAPASAATPKAAMANPKVGGAEMYPTKNIVENAVNSPIHTTLVTAVKQADLVDTLSSAGPFTVFAPTNDAFSRVDPTALATLMQPANKATLAKVLTYHVVPGRITAADLKARIKAGGGTAKITTVEGEPLTFTIVNGAVAIMGMNGNSSYVTQADVMQSNGVIHVVNGVLLPTM